MRITIITGHLAKERNPLTYELALDLTEYGHNVTVISGFPSRRLTPEVISFYRNNPTEIISDRFRVYRVGSKRGEGSGLLTRFLNYLLLSFSILLKTRKIDTDVFYIYSSPFLLGIVGSVLSRKTPTLYNIQDVFPDSLMYLKGLSERNILIMIGRIFERITYNGNTKIVTISEDMRNNIIKNGCPPNKISVIRNWVDLENIQPIKKENNSLFEKFGLSKDKFYISYAGNVGRFQNLSILTQATMILNNLKSMNMELVIIGDGACKKNLVEVSQNKGLSKIKFFPFQEQRYVSEVYSLGDIEILSLANNITKTSFPSKLFTIMAVGKPVFAIVDKQSELAKLIEMHKVGVVADANDPNNVAECIKFCYNNQNLLSSFGDNARAFAEKWNNRHDSTMGYDQILRNLIKNKELERYVHK